MSEQISLSQPVVKPSPPWASDEEHDAVIEQYLKMYAQAAISGYSHSHAMYPEGGSLCQCCGVMAVRYFGNRNETYRDSNIAAEFLRQKVSSHNNHKEYGENFRIKDGAGDLMISWNDE